MVFRFFKKQIKVKEAEKGCEIMCGAVERYADKKAQKSAEVSRINTLAGAVKMLMKNTSK